MKLSDILLLLKGKRAAVGEIRNWKGGAYIKTPTGWKPHEKQYSKKYTERKNNAATKKDTDLRKRQSEVARLSGEIQGHKAAVEHHTAQNTKQDTRQAKHHSIRAQVKQRRLDKHKEILEERHGVKDEVVAEKKWSDNPEIKDYVNKLEPEQKDVILKERPDLKANFEKWKADRQEEKPKETAKVTSGINERLKTFDITKEEFGQMPVFQQRMYAKKYGIEPERRARTNEVNAKINKLKTQSGGESSNDEAPDYYYSDSRNLYDEIKNKIKPTTPQEQPKPKTDVIQSGSRGATIAGQQYSKREVDILNSLDEIIGRAKSPVVQDLLKKRQAAKPTPKTSDLQPHESKFMELVKRNRSQADKQAGYPDERRKVEAETGVKIPREKAVEMTKHMKASFIWDIKKPLLIR